MNRIVETLYGSGKNFNKMVISIVTWLYFPPHASTPLPYFTTKPILHSQSCVSHSQWLIRSRSSTAASPDGPWWRWLPTQVTAFYPRPPICWRSCLSSLCLILPSLSIIFPVILLPFMMRLLRLLISLLKVIFRWVVICFLIWCLFIFSWVSCIVFVSGFLSEDTVFLFVCCFNDFFFLKEESFLGNRSVDRVLFIL